MRACSNSFDGKSKTIPAFTFFSRFVLFMSKNACNTYKRWHLKHILIQWVLWKTLKNTSRTILILLYKMQFYPRSLSWMHDWMVSCLVLYEQNISLTSRVNMRLMLKWIESYLTKHIHQIQFPRVNRYQRKMATRNSCSIFSP